MIPPHSFLLIQSHLRVIFMRLFFVGIALGIGVFTGCDSPSSSSKKQRSPTSTTTTTTSTTNPNSPTPIVSSPPDSCQESVPLQITDLKLKTCVNDTFFKNNQPTTSLGACLIKIMNCPQKILFRWKELVFSRTSRN